MYRRTVLVPVEFDDRETLATLLSECSGHRIELVVPQRGEKRSRWIWQGRTQSIAHPALPCAGTLAKTIAEALADTLMLLSCRDASSASTSRTSRARKPWLAGGVGGRQDEQGGVSQVQSADGGGSGRLCVDAEVVHRRYRRLKDEDQPMPSLVLIDGGLGQLHAAAEALESLGFTAQPLASIAKKEEVIYLYGNEDEPVVLDRRSPVLHLVQLIRDESHALPWLPSPAPRHA